MEIQNKTNEERLVFALESIADSLDTIAGELNDIKSLMKDKE